MKQQLEELVKKWEAEKAVHEKKREKAEAAKMGSQWNYHLGRIHQLISCITDLKQIIATL